MTGISTRRDFYTNHHEAVDVDCAPGYYHVGSHILSLTCLAAGTWTSFPDCVGKWICVDETRFSCV